MAVSKFRLALRILFTPIVVMVCLFFTFMALIGAPIALFFYAMDGHTHDYGSFFKFSFMEPLQALWRNN